MLGMKSDLRIQYQNEGKPVVRSTEGEKMAEELGCLGYCECSSLKMVGIDESMMFFLKTYIQFMEARESKKPKCTVQ